MPSVASDSPAVPPSRSPLPSLRNAADPNRNEPATPFAELLDSATPAPEPSPPPARADRPDRSHDAPSRDDSKPAGNDSSQHATGQAAKDTKDTKASDGTDPNNPKDAKTAKDAKAAKDAKTAKSSAASDACQGPRVARRQVEARRRPDRGAARAGPPGGTASASRDPRGRAACGCTGG